MEGSPHELASRYTGSNGLGRTKKEPAKMQMNVSHAEAQLLQALRALPEDQRVALMASAEQLRQAQYRRAEGAQNVVVLRLVS